MKAELKDKAIRASNVIIEKHINEGQPLAADLMVIRDDCHYAEQVIFKSGTILSGTVENLVDTEVFTDDSKVTENHASGDTHNILEGFT